MRMDDSQQEISPSDIETTVSAPGTETAVEPVSQPHRVTAVSDVVNGRTVPQEESRRSATTEEREGSWGSYFWWRAHYTFWALTAYVFSIGPMYWWWYESKFVGGTAWIAAFYEPLVWVAQRVPGFGEWLSWYVGLWIG